MLSNALPTKPTGASLARHRSEQSVETDPLFIQAVKTRFGSIDFDLAADEHNRQATGYYSREVDAFMQPWGELSGNLWLNCEFSNIEPWARMCREESARPHAFKRILLLTPASIGSNWFAKNVWGHAFVIALNGRLTFKNHTKPYPKDMILSVYGGESHGFDVWNWRTSRPRRPRRQA